VIEEMSDSDSESDGEAEQSAPQQKQDDGANGTGSPAPTAEEECARLKAQGNDAFRNGKVNTALSLWTEALEHAEDVSLYCNRAAAYLQLKQWSKCEEEASKALTLDGNYAKAYYRRGVAHHEMGQELAAAKDLLAAKRLDPDNAQIAKELKRIPAKFLSEAEAPAEKAQSRRLVIEDDDDDSEEEEEEPQNAAPASVEVAPVTAAADSSDTVSAAAPASAATASSSLGAELFTSEQPESARDDGVVAEAMQVKQLGNDQFRKGMFPDAVPHYTRALEILPDEPGYAKDRADCFNNRAACYKQMQQFDDVIADSTSSLALRRGPGEPKALIRRGLAFESKEMPAPALADMQRALSLGHAQVASEARGRLLPQVRRNEGKVPTQAEAIKALGLKAHKRGMWDEAAEYFLLAHLVYPKNHTYRLNRCAALLKSDRFGDAFEEAMASVKACPDAVSKAKAWYRAGQALAGAGKHSEAVQALEQGLALAPNNPDITSALDASRALAPAARDSSPSTQSQSEAEPRARTQDEGQSASKGVPPAAPARKTEAVPVTTEPVRPASPVAKSGISESAETQKPKAAVQKEATNRSSEQQESPKPAEPLPAPAESSKPSPPKPAGPQEGQNLPPAPKTSAEFARGWKQIKRNQEACAAYLEGLDVASAPSLLKTEDEELLMSVIDVIHGSLIGSNPNHAAALIKSIAKIPRVKILLRFLSDKEMKVIAKVFAALSPSLAPNAFESEQEWATVRNSFFD